MAPLLSPQMKMQVLRNRRRESLNYSQDTLLKRPSITVGRPKNKRPQRKLRPFPRQTSCSNRTKILKATRLLQKGKYTLALIKTILIQLHYYSTTDSSQASITEENYSRGIVSKSMLVDVVDSLMLSNTI